MAAGDFKLSVSALVRPDRVLRALVVDDDDPHAENIKSKLEEVGFATGHVGTLSAAQHALEETGFELVCMDNVMMEGGGERRGSAMIAEKPELFGQARVVLITGYPESQIVKRDGLNALGVDVVKKYDEGFVQRLREIGEEVRDKKLEDLRTRMQKICVSYLDALEEGQSAGGPDLGIAVAQESARQVIVYIKGLPRQDEGQFYFAGRAFTPRELSHEVQRGSDTGRKILRVFLAELFEAQLKDDQQ